MIRWVEGVFDRALCVLGAIVFSQAPEFFQQYLQRLGGHLDEARWQLDSLRSDPAVAGIPAVIGRLGERVGRLAQAESAIRQASAWSRPFVFARYFDPSIARSTWAVFKPAVPTTVEGAGYALVGIAVALLFYHGGVKGAGRLGARAWRRRRDRQAGAKALQSAGG